MKVWNQKSPYINEQDQQFIRELVDLLPNDKIINVVDLGVGHGTTALTVFYRRSINIFVVSFDVDDDNLDLAYKNMVQYGFDKHWIGIKCRSDVAPKQMNLMGIKFPIDLLMCDATHDYASQLDELKAWIPRLTKDSYIWIHDYADNPYPGVKRAVNELIAQGLLKEIKHGVQCWIGKTTGEEVRAQDRQGKVFGTNRRFPSVF